MLTITIKQGKEKSILAGDPWIYATAIERVDGRPNEKMKPGATAVVQSSSRQFLARAAYNARSQIVARVWTLDESQPIDHALIKGCVQAGLARTAAGAQKAAPDALFKRIDGEKDKLSGLIVQAWGQGAAGFLICQFNSAAVEAWKVPIVQALMAGTGIPNVYERCDELLRKGEGLPLSEGALAGESPPDSVAVSTAGKRVLLDLKTGQRM